MNESEIQQLQQRLAAIEQRNQRVELDKAWEVSLVRKAVIALTTYGVSAAVMFVLHITKPWLNALVPMLGYILSAQSLPLIKRWWLRRWL